jgi:acetyl esterase/lipase
MKRSLKTIILLLICYSASAQQVLPLYPDSIPNCKVVLNDAEKPTLTVYFPPAGKATGTAVIIFPGGGYSAIVTHTEGTPIAQAFVKEGITAIVVKYRLPHADKMLDKSMGPLMDAQQAMKMVRSKASAWNINPKKIGIIGFSAGGHLASSLGTHFKTSYISNKEGINLSPDYMILVYPVISMKDSVTHLGSRANLLGKEPTREKVLLFSNEEQVTSDTPPTYLTHSGDDSVVKVDHSIAFYKALQNKGVNAELHLFPKGNHGFVLHLPTNEWMQPIFRFIKSQGF